MLTYDNQPAVFILFFLFSFLAFPSSFLFSFRWSTIIYLYLPYLSFITCTCVIELGIASAVVCDATSLNPFSHISLSLTSSPFKLYPPPPTTDNPSNRIESNTYLKLRPKFIYTPFAESCRSSKTRELRNIETSLACICNQNTTTTHLSNFRRAAI